MDSVSLVLAIVALVISAGSGAVALLSLRQNAQHFPRPIVRADLTVRPADDGSHSWVRLQLQNMGNAEAVNVRYELEREGKVITHAYLETLAPRADIYDKWKLSSAGVYVQMQGAELLVAPGIETVDGVSVVVRWNQVPNLSKQKSKTIRPRVTTNLD